MKRGFVITRPRPTPASSLDVIRDAEFPLVLTSWKGVPVFVKARKLSQVQIQACGSFSLINLGEVRDGPFRWAEWVRYAEQNFKIVKAALVSPTVDEIFAIVGQGALAKESRARFAEIDALLFDLPKGPGRQRLEEERDSLRCLFDLLLPEDFVAPIVAYAVGIGEGDIAKITREMLLESAILAERGHDNPSDHMIGAFTDFNRDDINRRAWSVHYEWIESERRKKGGPHATH